MSPLICAHRGECGVAGLPAAERYNRAIELGVDYVEIDVRRTADGIYVNSPDGAHLNSAFATIASDIMRLSK